MYKLLSYALFHKLTTERPYFELMNIDGYVPGKDYDLSNVGWSFRTQSRIVLIWFLIKLALRLVKIDGKAK